MSKAHAVRLERPGRLPHHTPRDLATTQVAAEGYRRIGMIAGVVAGATTITTMIWVIERLTGQAHNPWDVVSDVALSLGALAMWQACRRSLFSPKSYTLVALLTEIIIAADLGASLMGWQFRVGDALMASAGRVGEPPFALGAGEVPWTGVWVLLFAAVVPLHPRQHLVGALLSVATLLPWPILSVAIQGAPDSLYPVRYVAALQVSIWLFARALLAAGIGYFAARSVHGLRKELAEARQIGAYQLREKLGEGGMGEVWRADHQMLARPAAIKLIKTSAEAGQLPSPDSVQRFEREVQAAARLRSPHTIQIYDYGLTEDGTFYSVMELLDGLDLEELIKRYGPLPWRRVVHIVAHACHSLMEAHETGLIHRDIKPANIFLCRLGRDTDFVKVLDFGLVKATRHAQYEATQAGLTQEGLFVGTPAYAAPELAKGAAVADARSDLYALGGVAFWLLTGRRPFLADSPIEMLIQHAREAPPPPSTCTGNEIPEALDRLILRCLAKSPADRPASADALAGDCELVLESTGQAAWRREEAAAWWHDTHPAQLPST